MDKSLAFPRLRIIFFQELGEEEMVTSMRFNQQMTTLCDALALAVIEMCCAVLSGCFMDFDGQLKSCLTLIGNQDWSHTRPQLSQISQRKFRCKKVTIG